MYYRSLGIAGQGMRPRLWSGLGSCPRPPPGAEHQEFPYAGEKHAELERGGGIQGLA